MWNDDEEEYYKVVEVRNYSEIIIRFKDTG